MENRLALLGKFSFGEQYCFMYVEFGLILLISRCNNVLYIRFVLVVIYLINNLIIPLIVERILHS